MLIYSRVFPRDRGGASSKTSKKTSQEMLNLSIDKLLVGSNPHNKYQSQEERKKERKEESSLKVFEGECFSLKVLRKVLTAVESL